MKISIDTLFHIRIEKHCEKLFDDGHYKHAALEAMTQVELALKERSSEKKKFGVRLIRDLFVEDKKKRCIQLRVLFGEDLQKQAEAFFCGAFSYFRNYAAHDGSKIDKNAATRIMIIASELLELIGASRLCLRELGGVKGLVESGFFTNEESVTHLLEFLDGQIIRDHIVDGFFEELYKQGFNDDQIHFVFDLGLVEYITKQYIPNSLEEELDESDMPNEISRFELRNQGKALLGKGE